MRNFLFAIDALLMLAESMTRITAVIQKARSEGRDITDAELAEVMAAREEAVKRLLAKE